MARLARTEQPAAALAAASFESLPGFECATRRGPDLGAGQSWSGDSIPWPHDRDEEHPGNIRGVVVLWCGAGCKPGQEPF